MGSLAKDRVTHATKSLLLRDGPTDEAERMTGRLDAADCAVVGGIGGKVESNGPVAQLDRASDFGSEGWGFDSLRGRQILHR